MDDISQDSAGVPGLKSWRSSQILSSMGRCLPLKRVCPGCIERLMNNAKLCYVIHGPIWPKVLRLEKTLEGHSSEGCISRKFRISFYFIMKFISVFCDPRSFSSKDPRHNFWPGPMIGWLLFNLSNCSILRLAFTLGRLGQVVGYFSKSKSSFETFCVDLGRCKSSRVHISTPGFALVPTKTYNGCGVCVGCPDHPGAPFEGRNDDFSDSDTQVIGHAEGWTFS